MRKNEKKKDKKIYVILLLILIILLLTVVGTIAWLTKVSSVSNTFTIGSFEKPSTSPLDPTIKIDIDGNIYEPSWNKDETHKLIPSVTFAKDPYVGLGKGSEDAEVYVYVENDFSNKVYFTINDGWEAVEATAGYKAGTYTSGLFKYTTTLNASKTDDIWTATPLFSSVATDETSTIEDFTVDSSKKSEIKVSSFLHQAKDNKGTAIPAETILQAAKEAFNI